MLSMATPPWVAAVEVGGWGWQMLTSLIAKIIDGGHYLALGAWAG